MSPRAKTLLPFQSLNFFFWTLGNFITEWEYGHQLLQELRNLGDPNSQSLNYFLHSYLIDFSWKYGQFHFLFSLASIKTERREYKITELTKAIVICRDTLDAHGSLS
jgi:hypothetical protein